jgi:hypothetical protein
MAAAPSVWGANASRVWCSASRRTEFSGGTLRRLPDEDACVPRPTAETAASLCAFSEMISERCSMQCL